MFGKINAKVWAALVLILGILFSAALAYGIAMEHATEIVYVAKERISNAPATIPMEQFSLSRALGFGIPVFLAGSLLSAALAELYYALLARCRAK